MSDPQPTPAPLPNLKTLLIKAVELLLVSLLNGVILVLGIRCISLLRNKANRTMSYKKLWKAYLVVLMFFNLEFLIINFVWTFAWLIYHSNSDQATKATFVVFYMSDLTAVILLGLTDVVLVWRCYMVHQALSTPNSWRKVKALAWIIPLVAYVITVVIGFEAEGTPPHLDGSIKPRVLVSQALALASNIFLNLYAPLFITTRLVLQRRKVIARLGPDAPLAKYLHAVNILLQSAILNVPFMIIGSIGLGRRFNWGNAVTSIGIIIQSFSAILMLHQVALGRALTSRPDPLDGYDQELSGSDGQRDCGIEVQVAKSGDTDQKFTAQRSTESEFSTRK